MPPVAVAAGQQQSCLVRLGDNGYSAFFLHCLYLVSFSLITTISQFLQAFLFHFLLQSASFCLFVCLDIKCTQFPHGQDFSIFRVYLCCDKVCFLCSSGRWKQHGLTGQTKEWWVGIIWTQTHRIPLNSTNLLQSFPIHLFIPHSFWPMMLPQLTKLSCEALSVWALAAL